MPSIIASTSLGLVWTTPRDAGKESDGTTYATINGYKVFYQEGATLNYSIATELDPSNTTITHTNGKEVILTNLKAGTQYTVSVRTTNSEGQISDSNTVTLRTKNYTKLGADGTALIIQNGTWSASGNETDGTQWSCVRDEGTGLVWEVKTDDGGDRDKDNIYKWGGFTALGRSDDPRRGTYYDDWNALVLYANDEQLTSATDDGDATEANPDIKTILCSISTNNSSKWRVPTIWELSTLINYNTHSPAYDATVFPNANQNSYWSASLESSSSTNAWKIHFGHGYDSFNYDRASRYAVRLVRGDSTSSVFDDSRYLNTNNGTITDNETGLVWKQCSEGQSGTDCSTGSAGSYSYEEAKTRARLANEEDNGTGFADHSDWRLPTIQELRTLIAYDRYNPSINTTIFPNTRKKFYWASSPNASNSNSAWSLHFGYGYDDDGHYNRTSGNAVRLVRGDSTF